MRILVLTAALCLMTVSGMAQQSLDDIDRQQWADAVSPLSVEGMRMTTVAPRKVKHHANDRVLSLSGSWLLSGHGIRVPARVPGSIHTALMEAGIIPDPRVGRNDTIAEQCSYQTWTLERTFQYDGTMTHPVLSFKGIANRCRVWINGKETASHEGMFGGPDIDVEGLLHRGTNTLKVELLPIPETYNGGWPATANEAWKHTVVVNCVYGWHYAKIPSMGIWDDVMLIDRPTVRMEQPFIMTRTTKGDMRLQITLPTTVNGEVHLLVTPDNFKGAPQAFRAPLSKAKGRIALDFNIQQPQLWWPNDQGLQPLYRAEVQLVVNGKVVSVCSRRFGIRTIEMAPFPEGPKEDLYLWTFRINGKEMFVKGTGWCTMDALLDFSKARYERFLTLARDQHIQLIRAWGGGLPETDAFYDLCDELGIMVIQEWPTAWNSHNTQPYEMLKETVERNTIRLRNHPALVMWGGGNESEKPYGEAIDMMGRLSVELDGTRPFHRAEAWGGSKHDYQCWWDERHLNHNLNMTARFWGEFGIPSLPVAESMARYMDGEHYQWPPRPESVFTHHTPIFGTNGEISRLAQYAGYFMPDSTLDGMILGSQLSQVVGVRHTLERARTCWPETTGALYYKLNDNYPGLSWSSIDYYGAAKPLHYFARRAFEPTTTVLLFDRTNLTAQEVRLPYYLLDDTLRLKGRPVTAHLSVWNHQMQCVADTTIHITPSRQVELLTTILLTARQTDTEMLYFKSDLTDDQGTLIARNWYFSNYETRPGVLLCSKAAEVTMTQEGRTVTIVNHSSYPAVGVTLSVPGQQHLLTLSDNYLWLDAGETRTIKLNRDEKARLTWWNQKRF